VKKTVQGLRNRGEQTSTLLSILFKAYDTVNNGSFKRLVEHLKYEHTRGKNKISPEDLMVELSSFYRGKVEDKQWNEPTKADAALIALQTEIKTLKAKAGKVGDSSSNRDRNTPKWMTVPPVKGANRKKEKNAKGKEMDWVWCPHHAKWGQHEPADCHKAKREGTEVPTGVPTVAPASTPSPVPTTNPTLQAMMSVYQQDSDDDSN
jgi:hypothetical protein